MLTYLLTNSRTLKAFLRRYAYQSYGSSSSASRALRRLGSKVAENSDLVRVRVRVRVRVEASVGVGVGVGVRVRVGVRAENSDLIAPARLLSYLLL